MKNRTQSDQSQSTRSGTLVIIVCLVVYLFIFVLKLFIGRLTGVSTLVSDGYHNLTDAFGFFGILMGFVIANRPPSKKFPYGLYKLEDLIGLGLALLIFYQAFEFIRESIVNFGGVQDIRWNIWGLIVPAISTGLIFICAVLLYQSAQLTNSPALRSESKQVLVDGYMGIGVFIGLVFMFIEWEILDIFLTIGISVLIALAGVQIFKDSVLDLLDRGLDQEKKDAILALAKSVDLTCVTDIQEIQGRRAGRYIFMEMSVQTDRRRRIEEIQDDLQTLRTKIQEAHPDIGDIVIVPQGRFPEELRAAIPLAEDNGKLSKISPHFGRAPNYAFASFSSNGIREIKIERNPHLEAERQIGILISEWVASHGVDLLLLREELHGGPKLVFDQSSIRAHLITAETLDGIPFSEIFQQEKATH